MSRRSRSGRFTRTHIGLLAVGGCVAVSVAIVVLLHGPGRPTSHEPVPTSTPQTTPQPPSRGQMFPMPVPARGEWHTYVVDLVLGRTDGTTPHAGSLRVWVDGHSRPAIDARHLDTLQRFNGKTQRWMQLWDGDYTQRLPQPSSQEFVLTRVGRTLRDALLDRPRMYDSTVDGQRYLGSGADDGPPRLERIASRSARSARIPASLGGNVSPPDPLRTYRVTLTPNYVSPNDDARSDYQAVWAYSESPSTPWRSPDSLSRHGRYLLVDPRATDADGRRGSDEFWFVIERRWPPNFDPARHGSWGTLVNLHNVAGDVGWGEGDQVSAVAMVWQPGDPAPSFHLEYN